MEFSWQWLLFAIPAVFALGWIASRLDGWQLRRERDDAPRAYYRGLALLLAEQQDEAIDSFVETVQADPDSTDLHFALGDLFRKRGEFERAVRVHQHLLARGDLSAADRERAQHALAQDYIKAGLFDRAEGALTPLLGTRFDAEARLALLDLHERARDWRAAMDTARGLEEASVGSFAQRMAHHACELAEEAMAAGNEADAWAALDEARRLAPDAARAWIQAGQWHRERDNPQQAWADWEVVRNRAPAQFQRIASAHAELARELGHTDAARAALTALYREHPSLDTLTALATLDGQALHQRPELADHLRRHPSLSAALAAMRELIAARLPEQAPAPALPGVPQTGALVGSDAGNQGNSAASMADNDTLRALALAITDAVAQGARPQQRYRCLACGFESTRYLWQCPGCLTWDSMPPQRIEEQ